MVAFFERTHQLAFEAAWCPTSPKQSSVARGVQADQDKVGAEMERLRLQLKEAEGKAQSLEEAQRIAAKRDHVRGLNYVYGASVPTRSLLHCACAPCENIAFYHHIRGQSTCCCVYVACGHDVTLAMCLRSTR